MLHHIIESIVDLLTNHGGHYIGEAVNTPDIHEQIHTHVSDRLNDHLTHAEIRFGVETPDPNSTLNLPNAVISGKDVVPSGDGTLYSSRFDYNHSTNPIDPKDIQSVTPPPSTSSSS